MLAHLLATAAAAAIPDAVLSEMELGSVPFGVNKQTNTQDDDEEEEEDGGRRAGGRAGGEGAAWTCCAFECWPSRVRLLLLHHSGGLMESRGGGQWVAGQMGGA